jgi:hypothetical protein
LLTDFLPQRLEAAAQRLRTRLPCGRTRAHHHIDRRELVLMHPERLADDAAETIACDRIACSAHGDRQAEARCSRWIHRYSQREQCITYAAPAGISGREIALAPQAKSRRQCEPPWHRAQTKILPKSGSAFATLKGGALPRGL